MVSFLEAHAVWYCRRTFFACGCERVSYTSPPWNTIISYLELITTFHQRGCGASCERQNKKYKVTGRGPRLNPTSLWISPERLTEAYIAEDWCWWSRAVFSITHSQETQTSKDSSSKLKIEHWKINSLYLPFICCFVWIHETQYSGWLGQHR